MSNFLQKNWRAFFLLSFSFCFISIPTAQGFAPHGQSKQIIGVRQLQRELRHAFLTRSPGNFFWGVRIESLEKNQMIYSLNDHKNFIPASNQKILTVAAAFNFLDTNFRYSTEVYLSGNGNSNGNTQGIFDGDVIVKSNGNPCIASHWLEARPTIFFQWLADSLKRMGYAVIKGDFIGDDSAFLISDMGRDFRGGDGDYPGSWEWGDMLFAMASPASAISFNENMVRVTAYPGAKVGDKPIVETTVESAFLPITNQAVTGEANSQKTIRITRELGTNHVLIVGNIPIGRWRESEPIAVEQPTLFFLTVMRETFEKKGILHAGLLRRAEGVWPGSGDSLRLLYRYESPRLIRILEYINKESNNFAAGQVLRTLGKSVVNEASHEAGLQAIEIYLESLGITEVSYRLKDGSGLSRQNLISPEALVKVLKHVYQSKYFGAFLNTLSVAGVDGTLSRRLVGTNAETRVFGKTGFLSSVRTFIGYVQAADGEWLGVSLMSMNYTQPTRQIESLQDEVLRLLANWRRK
ncbi:D-alanyl-D-alanine carboxypeptidase/D-alanyl-D-alanine-endopeptidase [Chloroherpeton thalassium ATCC 35110]|uniref:D-alanyl-D-alanine carboxypeptidase/D-alanyl-D-alanine-endopeptidase n=1 Tax=Chloroherpeton thalassium (strain ATCC 35110 / GB-78) TaxID=517418 RepID=B3QY12_CHLT3|nr:D-alanyl-D-alanine carboxypeptidase/D-alanyl-D-alanine-endopeptidase [Chloroherpeton thalassium]ACF13540.1 D-alanyl-D-alanine carboxypeptidase/D-alanyl-D-alanine-endopeptidase [Chloroherpeton thalassium ATCC 35110]